MKSNARGFTLVELVLALSILALMVTVLFGGLRVGIRAWQRGEDRASTLEHARSMSQLLEQTLAGAYPYQGQTEQSGQPKVLFVGDAGKLSFVTVSSPLPATVPIAFTAMTLSMDSGSAPGFAIRTKVLPNFDPFEVVTPSLLDASVTALRFRYLRDPDGGSWEDVWDGGEERALPRAVEVTLTAVVNGQEQEQPPITIPIRMTAP